MGVKWLEIGQSVGVGSNGNSREVIFMTYFNWHSTSLEFTYYTLNFVQNVFNERNRFYWTPLPSFTLGGGVENYFFV